MQVINGFKAILFISAGAVIHAFYDQQDLRRYGGLVTLMPLVYSALIIGSLSLIALPYLTGWYSKDGILEIAVGSCTISGQFVYSVGTLVAGLTAFYSVRLISLAFLASPRSDYSSYASAHDASSIVAVPLVILSILSVTLGYVSSDLFRGIGTDFIENSSPISPFMLATVDAEFGAPTAFKLGPLAATISGSFIAYWLYISSHGISYLSNLFNGVGSAQTTLTSLYRYFNAQWHFDALIIAGVVIPALKAGHSLSKVLDRGLLEALGPYGLQQRVSASGSTAVNYSTGRLTDYAIYIVLAMLCGVIAFAVPSLAFLSGLAPAEDISSFSIGMTIAVLVNSVSAYLVSLIFPQEKLGTV